MTVPYPSLIVQPLTGAEPFHTGNEDLGFDLASFWRWSASDLASNVWRGVLAEFLVARALGMAAGVRVEWDACDVRTKEGIRVGVKSAAYLQSWHQRTMSAISFDIGMKRGWDAETNTYAPAPCRGADVYVFALLAHQDKATLDPLDVDQWRFYVVPVRVIDATFGSQKRIALSSLKRVAATSVNFGALETAITTAVRTSALDVSMRDDG